MDVIPIDEAMRYVARIVSENRGAYHADAIGVVHDAAIGWETKAKIERENCARIARLLRDNLLDYDDLREDIERKEAMVKELESDLAACREFQDIAEARIAELEAALEELVMSLDLPGDHCEVEQSLPRARAALAIKEDPK